MATVFDVGGLAFFLPFFVFLFIFVVLYAVLDKTQLFGEKAKALNLVAAFSVAVVSIFTGRMVDLVAFIAPWFVLVFIIIIFISGLFIFFSFEGKEGVHGKGLGKYTFWTLIGEMPVFVILLIIVFIGITTVFESEISPYGVNEAGEPVDELGNVIEINKDPKSETIKALTHPRLLSALFLLIVASVAMKMLVDKYEP